MLTQPSGNRYNYNTNSRLDTKLDIIEEKPTSLQKHFSQGYANKPKILSSYP